MLELRPLNIYCLRCHSSPRCGPTIYSRLPQLRSPLLICISQRSHIIKLSRKFPPYSHRTQAAASDYIPPPPEPSNALFTGPHPTIILAGKDLNYSSIHNYDDVLNFNFFLSKRRLLFRRTSCYATTFRCSWWPRHHSCPMHALVIRPPSAPRNSRGGATMGPAYATYLGPRRRLGKETSCAIQRP